MDQVLEFVRNNHGVWTLAILGFAAALEYMLPPLPADTVVLAGSLLVVAGSWSFTTVYLVAVAGGFVGALSHYLLGRALRDEHTGGLRGQKWIDRLTGKGSLEHFFERFRRYGVWVIAINRMLPGVRAVTFLAAGAARLKVVPTMAFGLISNMAWTAILLFAGIAVGGRWEKIESLFSVYSRAISVMMILGIAGFVVFRMVRKRRRAS